MRNIINNIKKTSPLVHHITNYVTVNDCANVVLAAGGAPLMADDLSEVEDIVSISSVLYINIGTLNQRTIDSMILAGRKANQLGLPIVLDPVGMGASELRNQAVHQLMKHIKFSVIKGNMSEIKGLYHSQVNTGGVDVKEEDQVSHHNLKDTIEEIKKIARALQTTLAVTGPIDIVSDGQQVATISNGHANMSRVTGTGCMTGSIIATYLAVNKEDAFNASITALVKMGLSGEYAQKTIQARNEGISSFKRYLIDGIDLIDIEEMEAGGRIEYL